jgi:putative tricarboxylic transport membrane protein
MMATLGLLIGMIGTDPIASIDRFTFGSVYLVDGVGLIPLIMGLFGISEIFSNLEEEEFRGILKEKIKGLFPTLKDWMDSKWPILRGTIIGFFIGILPGGNAIIASIMSYAAERRISKHPEKFGTGIIEGVAGPEAANNASAQASFIPLLSLGIPTNAVMALLLASLMIHEVLPGPLLIKNNPDIFWSVIASMYIGNIMLLLLNLPLIGLWIQVLKVPYAYLFPFIFIFCLLGTYSLTNSVFDIGVMIFFGIIGYLMKKFAYEPTPLILAFVLGSMFEDNFRRSLIVSGGSFLVFLERPIAAVFIIAAAILLLSSLFSTLRAKNTASSKL